MSHIYKGYIIKPSTINPHSLTIAVEGKGGKIPKIMEGIFTSRTLCMTIIDNYLESKGG